MDFKRLLLDAAEVMDAHRVVPKLFMLYFMWEAYTTAVWFRGLPDPSTTQGGYTAALWAAVAGALKFYFDTGRKWGD